MKTPFGIGTDIVEIRRFEQIKYSRHRPFYERIFTAREIEFCLSFRDPAPHFAVNFAGKEAVCKAIQTSCSPKLREIEILRDKKGAPRVSLHLKSERSRGTREHHSHFQIELTLSHSSSHAIAFALANSTEQGTFPI
jgi:holo-[acyl-carrier protein] synthase